MPAPPQSRLRGALGPNPNPLPTPLPQVGRSRNRDVSQAPPIPKVLTSSHLGTTLSPVKTPTQPRESPASELAKSHTAGHGAASSCPRCPRCSPRWEDPGRIRKRELSKHPRGQALGRGSETQPRAREGALLLSQNFVSTPPQKGRVKGEVLTLLQGENQGCRYVTWQPGRLPGGCCLCGSLIHHGPTPQGRVFGKDNSQSCH